MMALLVDGIIPFFIISIMNTLIVRAIQQRHREFDAFNVENTSRPSGNNESGNIKRMNWRKSYPDVAFFDQQGNS